MAPIPTIQKKKARQQAAPSGVAAADVYDSYGRPLDRLLRRQRRTDRQQSEDITVSRQHARQYESDTEGNVLVYRDVFPGRKYKLTLSDTSWIGDGGTVTVGYTVGSDFHQLTATRDGSELTFEIPDTVAVVDTVEVRLTGAPGTVRGYLDDETSAGSLLDKIAQILQDIIGLGSRVRELENTMQNIQDSLATIQDSLATMQDSITALDDRVTALEDQ